MKYEVEIPEPCHKNWAKMTSTERGRFCQSCQKEVVDFTSKLDSQILEEINEEDNLCGRFRKDQLNRKLNKNIGNSVSKIAASIALTAILANPEPTFAQGKPMKVKKNEVKERTISKDSITIKGIIKDKEGALPGVLVLIKGTKFETNTDIDGSFSIVVKKSRKFHKTLVFEYLGYKTVELQLVPYQEIDHIRIVMQEDKDFKFEEITVGRLK